METTATKINAVLNAISQDIADCEGEANTAMNAIEKMSTDPEEFKEANIRFALNTYVANYLNRIKAVVMERDLQKAENIIRFHAHHQHAKGNMDDGSVIAVAQGTLAVILDSYVANFFEA